MFKTEHFSVNGFANAWLVENNDLSRETDLVIEYWPQRLFYWGVFLLILVLLGLLLASLAFVVKKWRRSV